MQYYNLFEEYYGKKIVYVECAYPNGYADELVVTLEGGTSIRFYHEQDCCECVSIEDIDINLQDLVGSTLVSLEVTSNYDDEPECGGSQTWTFYKIQTDTTCATVRWLGSSNGYYSESVDSEVITTPSGYITSLETEVEHLRKRVSEIS